MNKKIIFLLSLSLLFAVLRVPTASAGKSYWAERFDVQLDLLPGGDMIVTEAVVFRFEGGPFTYAFRHISAKRTDGLTFLEASMDGVPLPQGTQAGQVEVQPGDPLKVTWHFSPTGDSMHTFVVRYRATGVVSTGQVDTLRWYVIPPDHEYPIGQSTVWLNYPPSVFPLKTPSLDRTFDVAGTAAGLEFTTFNISANEGVILTAEFPAGSVARTMPQWQVREQEMSASLLRSLPVGLVSGLATLIFGGLGLLALVLATRRDLNLPPLNPVPTLPDDRVPPPVVGRLLDRDNYTVLGALLDLAQRGVLQMSEEKGRWGSRYLIEWIGLSHALRPYEQGLLQTIFKPGEKRVELSQAMLRLSLGRKHFEQPLEQELLQRDWLDLERKRGRTLLKIAGVLSSLVGLVLTIVGIFALVFFATASQLLVWIGAALAGFGGGVFLLSSPLLIYASRYSLLTPVGEEQKLRWRGFQTYLHRVIAGQEPAMRPDAFERYLAYAAALGLGRAWVSYFQKIGGVSLPSWFHSLANTFDPMLDLIDSMLPTSSSDGGDGGGASGGGSSGAG